MSSRSIAAVGLSAALVFGGFAAATQATAIPIRLPVESAVAQAAEGTADAAARSDVSAALAAQLLSLVDEERMAHDLYQLFSDTYAQARPFSMIVNSETQHTASVRSLLAAYGIADPTAALPAGTYASPEIQALYDQWKVSGLTSVEAAEQVGVDLEVRDIADLKSVVAGVTQTDIRRVLERLIAASENHLRAFRNAVATTGPVAGMPGTAGMPCNGTCDLPGNGAGQGAGQGAGPGGGMGPGAGFGGGFGARSGR